jgi:hypothetical protein
MSLYRATELRQELVTRVYPELIIYLDDEPLLRVAEALGLDNKGTKDLGDSLSGNWYAVQCIVGGLPKLDGGQWPPWVRSQVWGTLSSMNKNPDLEKDLMLWLPSYRLRKRLFGETVETLTGRIRAGCDYGEARNTPFQGLAADGAKLALCNLDQAGIPVVAFIHDEIVAEVDADKAEEECSRIKKIMVDSMAEVIDCDLPIEVEAKVVSKWGEK